MKFDLSPGIFLDILFICHLIRGFFFVIDTIFYYLHLKSKQIVYQLTAKALVVNLARMKSFTRK